MILNKYYGLNTLCETLTIHVRPFVRAIISCYEQNNSIKKLDAKIHETKAIQNIFLKCQV